MTRHRWMILAVAAVGLVSACGCARSVQTPAASVEPTALVESTAVVVPDGPREPTRQEAETAMLNQWLKTQRRFSSAAQAGSELPFTLKMPKPSLVPSPAVIYVEIGRNRPRVATVLFGGSPDGVLMTAIRSKMKPDPEFIVEQDRVAAAEGLSKADATFELIRVNGLPGYGIEPGVNTAGPARFRLRPGVVVWWDHGVNYELHGTKGPDGTRLAELVRIAESVH